MIMVVVAVAEGGGGGEISSEGGTLPSLEDACEKKTVFTSAEVSTVPSTLYFHLCVLTAGFVMMAH